MTVSLWSRTADDFTLRRVGEQVEVAPPGVPRNGPHGGGRRTKKAGPGAARPGANVVAPGDRPGCEPRARRRERECASTASFVPTTAKSRWKVGHFYGSTRELAPWWWCVRREAVYLRDVAKFIDGPEEPTNYTRIGFGPGEGEHAPAGDFPAVTVGVAKRKGSNAVSVSQAIEAKVEELKAT